LRRIPDGTHTPGVKALVRAPVRALLIERTDRDRKGVQVAVKS
jgi:hypothetical protein